MHRTRPIAVLASAGLAASMVALGGCSVQDAGSRVAVLGESTPPAPAAPAPAAGSLGAGDALGDGLHQVILARTAGGASYATVTDDSGRP